MKITEAEAREMTYCLACKDQKEQGLVVCWTCFKYIDNPLKYSGLELSDWLKEVNQSK